MKQKVAPPPGADEVVFVSSNKEYPREPQVVQGKRAAPEFDQVTLDLSTVADAAQVYADFARKEVRVPRAVLDRKMSLASANSKIAFSYVGQSLDWMLPYNGIEIEQLGRGVVAFRAGKTFQERMAAERPAPATAEHIAAATKAMSEEQFWEIVESATRKAGNDCFALGDALKARLGSMRLDQILGFELRLQERFAEAHRDDLWAIAYIVNGGASDDGFQYFCGWLIAQGRDYFRAALKDPIRAADRAQRHGRNECEEMLYPGMEAYRAKTNQYPPLLPINRSPKPGGLTWSEEDLPRLYPELVKKFR